MLNQTGKESPLIVTDLVAWRDWLVDNAESSDGIWLMLAKKGVTSPTSVKYQEALEEALCSGWIDGQRKSLDDQVYLQRFTPRRARSLWSKRNVDIVTRLTDEGRMRPGGAAEIDRAKTDGRWERAYAGPATAEVPVKLQQALDQHLTARAAFDALTGSSRYSALHPILTAPNDVTEQRRINALIKRLESGV